MSILETADSRLWLILLGALLLVAALLLIAFLVLRGAAKKEQPPVQALAVPGDSPVAASFRSGLEVLRGRVAGGSYQYRVPWILLIGTPGSGKTAILDCLASAALPLNETDSSKNKGIAWGFLNHGVLIDVPGSLLLGPNPAVASNESGWNQLLRRLNRHRPARPLDGVVLTIGADELLDPKADITARGGLIRAKLDQLQSAIGLVLPVYILVTRCDCVRGFEAWCGALDQVNGSLKNEMFGWSNNHTLESVFTWVWVDEAMNAVGRMLHLRQLGFFGAARPLQAADDLYLFPPNLDILRGPLQILLTQLFVPVSYRDAHYFRGVYFSGLPAAGGPSAGGELLAPNSGRSRLPLAFLNDLFERKVFVERTLARPVPQRFFFRNRVVLSAQIFAVVFSLVMAIGLALAWHRLRNDSDHRIFPVIQQFGDGIHVTQGPKGTLKCPGANADSAYSLLQTLAYIHAIGFSSIFMPTSWGDPIESQLEGALTNGFNCIVLNAFQTGLEQKYTALTASTEQNTASRNQGQDAAAPAIGAATGLLNNPEGSLLPVDDPQYQELRNYVTRLAAVEKNIGFYDNLRIPGSGSIADVRELLQYLTGKTLPGDDLYRKNLFFTRAIADATWADIRGIEKYRKDAADQTQLLISQFYAEWFGQSALQRKVDGLKSDILALEQARPEAPTDLRRIAGEIAELDTVFSGNSIAWLEQPFTRNSYPALAQLDAPVLAPVFSQEFKDQSDTDGRAAWLDLRTQLLSDATGPSGPMLEEVSNRKIQLASPVRALGSNLAYLPNLDFMASSDTQPTPPLSQTPVAWNADMLAEALKLNTSWEKYQHDVLPSVPGGMQAGIRLIAQRGLAATMADIIVRAQTPVTTSGVEDAMTAELKSFDQVMGQLKQLQSIGEKLGDAGKPVVASLNLYLRAIRLLGGINASISSNSLYSWQKDALQKWDGTNPLSQVLYSADSPSELADDVAADHQRLQSLVESADPLVQLLSAGGLPVGNGTQTVYWGKLGADFKQFGDKKPGNPIAALEGFLEKDIDKIVPENRCQGGSADPRVGDPFIEAMNTLRTGAVRSCLVIVQQHYTALANNFTQHLAGKFPFSADNTAAVEADPNDVANFFDLFTQNSPGLVDSLDRLSTMDSKTKAKTQDASAFLRRMALIQPLFATADKDSLPALDVTVQFRSNQAREAGGYQIIDWDLRIGDQVAQYQSASKPIRWHYGDRITLTMRYAKNSPNVPILKDPENDLTIGDRRIIYTYGNAWSLFEFLIRHAASATDFDNPLAPIPNTVRLEFGNAPGSAGVSGAKLADTVVFATLNLQSPAAQGSAPKEGAAKNAVVVSAFPVSAPSIQ